MTYSRSYPRSESAPVAWRWRNILGGPDHWTYSAERPADHPQYITEPLYVAPQSLALAQTAQVTFAEPRNVTAADREYASELLADLTSYDLPRLEIAARWFRKARVEHSLPGNHAQSSQEAREKEITRLATIEECAQLIESGAGMADLIDQYELDQQAEYIRALALPSTDRGGK